MPTSKSIRKTTYYNQLINELIDHFETDPDNGLKSSYLEKKYQRFGYNELPKIKKSIWKIYLAPIFNFLILILLITGIIVVFLGSPGDTIITFTVVIINSSTVIIQQYRAQKALESLRQIAALKATVLRDGDQLEIPNRELVPGDIIILDQGDKIPADSRIINSINLTVDEAALTGESKSIEKVDTILEDKNIPIQKQSNMIFMGTYVHTGRAKALVTTIGADTEIGKISTTLNELGSIEEIPLTKKLNRLGYILGTIVVINLIILISYKFTILINDNEFFRIPITTALVDSITRATNILPINLPLLSTLVLITGVLSMAQQGVIIKNLSAIESLGRVSVICSDKTGTITKNEMTIKRFSINDQEYEVSGSGYEPEGKVLKNHEPIDLTNNPTFQKFIDSMVLNNNATLVYEDIKVKLKNKKEIAIRKALGDPTEASLLTLSEKTGNIPYDLKGKYELLKEYSFSSELKRMSTIFSLKENNKNIFVFSKGAPENIVSLSSQIEINDEPKVFDENAKESILEKINEQANLGYRTLAIAYKTLEKFNEPKRDEIEQDLIFLGFVSIIDAPRPGVKEAVEECQSGNIKIIMITGDHKATAKTIASQLGIFKEGDMVVEGKELNDLKEENFEKISVFARVEPSDKEIIVRYYQKNNHVVAMTGDGINDSLALKLANAGIAMGTGTDVAKETADMVISDDNFTSIEKGVKIGRGLFSKIRTIIYFFICLNIMEAIIFFTYEFIPGFQLFSSNWQHIYIFGIVHSFPSLALVIDKHPKDIMNEPPRDEEQILNKNMWIMLLIQAFFMGLGLVLALQLTLGGIIPLNEYNINPTLSYIPVSTDITELTSMKARTMFITTLYIVETNFIWTIRRPNKPLYKSLKEEFNRSLFIICIFTLVLHILFICFSYPVNHYVNDVFGLNFQINFMFLSATDWLLCILLAIPGIFGIEIFKWYARKRNIFF
ncbi:MAG: cation-translocating P-type ATPase [Candidatus Thorarchaeota archaeon]